MSLIFNNYDYHFWAAIQRIFITTDPVLETHFTIQNPVVETGDFDWTFTIAPSDAAVFYGILGNTALGTSDNVVAVQPTTSAIRVKVGGVDQDFNSVIAPTSVLSICRITRVGTQMTVTIGLTSETKTVSTDTFTIDVIGVLGAALPFNGIIANVDLGNGNAWKLDRATGNTEQAAGGGNDLTYVNAPASTRESMTFNQSEQRWVAANSAGSLLTWSNAGSWVVTADTAIAINESLALTKSFNDGRYDISFEVFDYDSGEVTMRDPVGAFTWMSANGTFERSITVSTGEIEIDGRGSNVFTGSVRKVLVKRFIEVA